MLKQLADMVVADVRKRVSEGDCPTTPAHSVETLENVILALSAPSSPAAETKLREALLLYGRHREDCLAGSFTHGQCTCGLLAALTQPEPTAQQGEVCSACLGENKAQGEYRCLQCNGTGLAKDNAFNPAAPQGGEE